MATLQDMAQYLSTGYWLETRGNSGARWDLNFSDGNLATQTITYSVDSNWNDSNGLSAQRAHLVEQAFDYISNVTGIHFLKTDDYLNCDIAFSDWDYGCYSVNRDYNADGYIDYSYINIDYAWANGYSGGDAYVMQTIIHEIGHSLGLGHPGNYNGSASFWIDADYVLDSWQATIMSYFSQDVNPFVDADFAFVQTFMPADLLALYDLYGTNGGDHPVNDSVQIFETDTVYGFGTNLNANDAPIMSRLSDLGSTNSFSIVDTGGVDTIDVSGWNADQLLDLRVVSASDQALTYSSIGGLEGNLVLAVGTVIENAIGGGGNDILIGNGANNTLIGNNGSDIFGTVGGQNYVDGGAGLDTVMYLGDSSQIVNVERNDSGFTVITATTIDTLVGVEQVSFDDGTFSLVDLVAEGEEEPTSEPEPETTPDVDTAPPELTALSLVVNSTDGVGSGTHSISGTATIADNSSGLHYASIRLVSPTGDQSVYLYFGEHELESGTLANGVFQDTQVLSEFLPTGTWTVAYADMFDQVGNHIRVDESELVEAGLQTSVEIPPISVEGGPDQLVDTTPVELTGMSFEVESTNEDGYNGVSITVTATIKDDLSGVSDWSYIRLDSPSGEQSVYLSIGDYSLVSGSLTNGVFQDTAVLPEFSETGTWTVAFANLWDQVGNHVWLGESELAEAGLPTSIEVSSTQPGDEISPVTSVVTGTADSDIIFGSAANDQIDGKGGIDTVVYSGMRGEYLVDVASGSMEDLIKGRDGTDTVANVERLQFSDSNLALDIEGIAGQAYRIYKAAFDRAPDAEGLGFWINQMDEGTDLTSVAQGFIGSQEFESMYGEATDNEFIELLYENVLDRQPDAQGYEFWKDTMHEAGLTREEVLVEFSESIENVNNTEDLISNGITYNPFFS